MQEILIFIAYLTIFIISYWIGGRRPRRGIFGDHIKRLSGEDYEDRGRDVVADSDFSTLTNRVSVAHPKRISKRQTTVFLVNIYFPKDRALVLRLIRRKFGRDGYLDPKFNAILPQDSPIQIALSCPDIQFSSPVKKTIEGERQSLVFTARPEDSSHHGETEVKISITDSESEEEFLSDTFSVFIADFAFDHVSHPKLMTRASISLLIGSVIAFVFVHLEAVGLAFGLTLGTLFMLIGAAVHCYLHWTYYRLVTSFVHNDNRLFISMRDMYNALQAGAVGPNAQASNNSFQQIWNDASGKIDLAGLASELSRLGEAMRAEGVETSTVEAAEKAATDGDGPKALEYLKKAGTKALEIAEKTGVSVAVAAIKSAIGV